MFLDTPSGSKRLESHDGTAGRGRRLLAQVPRFEGMFGDNLLEGCYWMVGEMMKSCLKVASCLK